MDAVAQCAAPAAGAGAAGGLAVQPIFVFQPVEGGLYRLIRRQAAPLIAAHVAQREAVFQLPAFQLGRQRLCRSQPIILQQSVAAPRVGFEVLAPGCRVERRFLRDGPQTPCAAQSTR